MWWNASILIVIGLVAAYVSPMTLTKNADKKLMLSPANYGDSNNGDWGFHHNAFSNMANEHKKVGNKRLILNTAHYNSGANDLSSEFHNQAYKSMMAQRAKPKNNKKRLLLNAGHYENGKNDWPMFSGSFHRSAYDNTAAESKKRFMFNPWRYNNRGLSRFRQ